MKYITIFDSETGNFEVINFPEEGSITSNSTGYAIGKDVYAALQTIGGGIQHDENGYYMEVE